MKKKTAFNRKSDHPQNAHSPLDQNTIHEGLEGIQVKLIDYPDEKRFKQSLSKMVGATIGGNIDADLPNEIGEELFKGGLQTGLEAAILVFEISGVSRAFTHQFVRTRKAAYHQQSSRYTYMGDHFNVRMPQTIANNKNARKIFEEFVTKSRLAYKNLAEENIPFQDCRFVAPIGIETYIIGEFPLKTFLDTYAYRACPMFQWEITHVFKLMKQQVIKVLPWMEQYIKISCEKTHKCMFQGWEETESECDFAWAGDRIFKSIHKTGI